jgi:adenylate cyclase
MFTDMVASTALGQRDEPLSIAMVGEQRRLLRPVFMRHNGREVKTMGDGFLVEFPSALDAVRCAYDVQRATREFNISLPSDKRLHLRVGVHLGDVVESQGDIAGDAVNLASRIEPLAEDDGVCVTRQVYDHVKNKFELPLESLGSKSLRNITEPLEVYKMVMPWEERKAMQPGPLDGKRIAILPFANISQDGSDEYFADGMTEELISRLSRIRDLKVISSTSAMRYKATSKSVGEIAKELGVGTILEGSVRIASGHLRVSTKLIDTRSDEHIWSQDYDRKLEDVFRIQREIGQKVAEALRIRLLSVERKDMERRVTESPQAHKLYLRGRQCWNERSKGGLDKASKYFEEAIKLDSKYALAYSGLADCYVLYGAWGFLRPDDSFPRAKEYATKSIETDPRLAEPHATLADVFNSCEGRWAESEAEYRRALELNPSYATAHMWYGLLLLFLTRFDEARDHIKMAIELDPLTRVGALNLGGVSLYEGRAREAVEQIEDAVAADPEFTPNRSALAWAYYADSRTDEGISEMRKAVRMSGGSLVDKADLACLLGSSGRTAEARSILREIEEASKFTYVSKMKIAQVLFSLAKFDEAFELLQEAQNDHSLFTQHGSYLLDMRLFPSFASVRKDARWGKFVGQLKIPEA